MQIRAEASLSAVSSPWLTPLQPQHCSSPQEASSVSFKPSNARYGHPSSQEHSSDQSHGSNNHQACTRAPSDAPLKQHLSRHDAPCLRQSQHGKRGASCSCECEDMPEIHSPGPEAPAGVHAASFICHHDTPAVSSSPELLCAQQRSSMSQPCGLAAHKQQVRSYLCRR